jgi:D-glycero-D-manno-heptose 1,7-bisphosphate phosphatase
MRDYFFREVKSNKKAVFFDRDGTINVDVGYGHKVTDYKLFSDSVAALKTISDLDVYIFIATNQSGIALKKYGVSEMSKFNRLIIDSLKKHGIEINAVYYCPHYSRKHFPERYTECNCSKPMPGLLLEAAKDFNIDLSESIIIGDQPTDIGAGMNAGINNTIMVTTGLYINGDYTRAPGIDKYTPKYVVPNLLVAADTAKSIIQRNSKNSSKQKQ